MNLPEFWLPPATYTIWDILNSQFLTTVLAAAFGVLLLRYELKLREAQEETRVAEEALQARKEVERKELEVQEAAEPDLAADPLAPPAGVNRRDEARQLIEGAKAYLLQQAHRDPDGRHQRTYEKISGHYPLDLAVALRDRGRLSEEQFNSAFALFSVWRPYSRGRGANNAVPNEVYNHMRACSQQLIRL